MYSLKIIKLIIAVVFLYGRAAAQTETLSDAQEENHKLTDEGKKYYESGKYVEALEYFTKAEAIAIKYQLQNEICTAKNNIGNIYGVYSNYGEALGYYKEALALARANRDSAKKIPHILNNIGFVYYTEQDYKTALEYYQQSYNLGLEQKGDEI